LPPLETPEGTLPEAGTEGPTCGGGGGDGSFFVKVTEASYVFVP
jgi:hypothetical protein